jgi:dihydroorotase
MKVLLKQAKIVCPTSSYNGQTKDILIEQGIIISINDNIIDSTATIISNEGLQVSIGWMDVFAHFADPGLEYRETLQSGANAAAAGGFTDVLLVPNTQPVIHNKSQVEYIVQQSKSLPVTLHPIGAVTKDAEGKELAEMYDMQNAGAIAFGDGINSIQNAGLLVKALQYIKTFNGTIIQIPEDKSIGATGLMNEGIISTRLGLPGKPAMAEELMVERDIKLARYSDSSIHFSAITTAKSLEYIRRAKDAGIAITCSVTPYHLFFCDEDLQQYDTNLKVNPPLRTKQDSAALLAALLDGSVDCIASHHIPQHADSKICEFEYAKPGMIGLESLFSVVWQLVNTQWSIEQLVEKLTIAPRKLFNINIPKIEEGAIACLTLFNPDMAYTFVETMIQSKSKNSAFIGQQFKGKVLGIIHKNQLVVNK